MLFRRKEKKSERSYVVTLFFHRLGLMYLDEDFDLTKDSDYAYRYKLKRVALQRAKKIAQGLRTHSGLYRGPIFIDGVPISDLVGDDTLIEVMVHEYTPTVSSAVAKFYTGAPLKGDGKPQKESQ